MPTYTSKRRQGTRKVRKASAQNMHLLVYVSMHMYKHACDQKGENDPVFKKIDMHIKVCARLCSYTDERSGPKHLHVYLHALDQTHRS